jgi:hypothetical protein
MDKRRFDAIARFLNAIQTRRGTLRHALAGVVGIALLADPLGSGASNKNKKRRRPGKRKERRQRRRPNRRGRPRGGPGCDVCEDAGQCAFTSIQAAISAANPQNPVIRVCKGTYKERIVIDRNISLVGQPDASGRPTIDAKGAGTAVTVNTGVAMAMIANFTITGGEAEGGGGIVNRGGLRLQSCEISGNDATATFGRGGGILNTQQGTLVLADTIVKKNAAKGDGGLGGGIFNDQGQVTISESLVTDNDAKGFGGGICNSGGRLVLQAARVTKNDASNGGGLFNQLAGQVTLAEGSRVFDNDPNNCVNTNACGA